MIADLQQFFGVNIEDVWRGLVSPAHVLDLIQGLYAVPQSRWRAAVLTDEPPARPQPGTPPSWLGWTPEVARLTAIADLITAALAGKKAKPLPTPLDRSPVVTTSSIREFTQMFQLLR
ncbi:hypothetical protein [Pseudoclavibacter sp. 13-3]|uniref:hypothetical protein n=1 Tax=Pseudoclavibacter sp. 13-3 TaxID=2901228 RepID=UPI001E5E3071|nr:hypothetical protein [Pseudoclavibacter sp. 13-3]MCD7100448.1 hypothetical protein [Pseudoclavibacter sp. 13-3]